MCCELEVIYILSVFAMAKGRFRLPKTIEEELCAERAVPKSTRYKNKWAVGILRIGNKCEVSSFQSSMSWRVEKVREYYASLFW